MSLWATIGVVGGDDTNACRDQCYSVFTHLTQLFTFKLNIALSISTWDYRLDPPEVVAPTEFAARSLDVVDRAEALIAIFDHALPDVTCREIRRAFERRQRGEAIETWVFLRPETKTDEHDGFVARILADFGEQIRWTPYSELLDFQAKIFTTLLPYLLERTGFHDVSLGGPSH